MSNEANQEQKERFTSPVLITKLLKDKKNDGRKAPIIIQTDQNGWGGRGRTHEWRYQKPLPYHLATPQNSHDLTRFKNTIFFLILAALLGFSLYSKASAQDNTTVNKPEFKIQQELSPANSLIQNMVFSNQQLMLNDLENIYLDGQKLPFLQDIKDDESNLNIKSIVVKDKDFYLNTTNGSYKNSLRIFHREASNHLAMNKKKIFVAAENGIYESDISKDKNTLFQNNWQLIANSPINSNFISLDKKEKHLKFASAPSGFYYFNSTKQEWVKRSHSLSLDFHDSYGFGRFLVRRDSSQNDEVIFLPSSSGLFISNDEAKSWNKKNQGLESNPDGFYTLREVIQAHNLLFLISSNGIYYSHPQIDKIYWQRIPILSSAKNENMNEDFFSIASNCSAEQTSNCSIFITDSQGNLFSISFPEQLSMENSLLPLKQNILNTENIFSKYDEPSVQQVQKRALDFAGIPTGYRFNSYKIQARARNLLPSFEAFVTRDDKDFLSIESSGADDFNSNSSSLSTKSSRVDLNRDDNEVSAGFKLSWDLAKLVYDPEINSINTNARITANVRENILTEVTQIYFARRELQFELLELEQTETGLTPDLNWQKALQEMAKIQKRLFQKQLEFEQYTAQLDARTGGWFSEQINKNQTKTNS